MALKREEILSQIELASDLAEINVLNQKYASIEKTIGILTRNIESIIRTINLINTLDAPAVVLANCRSALEAELTRYTNELKSY